jgi:acetyl esterase/lipase
MKRTLIVTVLASLFSQSLLSQTSTPTQARVEANVIYGMYSGLALLMDVHYPERTNGYGVLFIPGSGWHASLSYQSRQLKDSVRGWHAEFFRPLVDAGYTVFVINHRAAPRFRYPAAVEDAQRAVRFIRHHAERFGINADRIGGFGYSSGAHVIAMVGVLDGKGNNIDADPVNRESAKLQSVVAGATPSDLLILVSSTSATAVASFMGLVVPPWEGQASEEYRTYKDASPVHHVTPDDAPLLLIHGDADEEVPFQQATRMEEAARKAGLPVRLVRIPGGTHGDLRKTAAPDYVSEMVKWHDQQLRGAR